MMQELEANSMPGSSHGSLVLDNPLFMTDVRVPVTNLLGRGVADVRLVA